MPSSVHQLHPTLATVGGRLKAERQRLHLTQQELSAAAGVARRAIGEWERDATLPSIDDVARLTNAGADVAFIVTGERRPSEPVPTPHQAGMAIHRALNVLSFAKKRGEHFSAFPGDANRIVEQLPRLHRLAILLGLLADELELSSQEMAVVAECFSC